MVKKSPILDIQIADKRWGKIPHLRQKLEAAAQATFAHLPKKFRFPCSVTLLLTDDRKIQRLNRDFRGFDKPTNVLSFPQFAPDALPKKGRNRAQIPMGDVIIAYQYMVVEAKKDNKLLINHVIHLMIHGLLHLFGYAHDFEKQAVQMEGLEKRIMKKLGLPDPYQPAPMQKTKSKIRRKRKS